LPGGRSIERAFELGERRCRGPLQAEGRRRLAQPPNRASVRLGHDAEQAGMMRPQGVGDGQIGSEGQGGVAILGFEPRAKQQFEIAVAAGRNLLLGGIDARRAPAILGRLIEICQLGKIGG
jgi:hypothetical protein